MRSEVTPIVLLPGLDGTGDLFAPFVATAPPRFEPVVISLPHSGSYDGLVDYVRTKLPPGNFVILGESFSGPLAVRVAYETRDRVIAVVLCNTFSAPPFTALLRFFPWSLLFAIPPPRWLIRVFFVGFDTPSSLVDQVRTAIAKTPGNVLAARMRAVFSLAPLPPIDAPVIHLSGTRDRLIHSQGVAVDAPHLLLQTRPREAWDAILRALPDCID